MTNGSRPHVVTAMTCPIGRFAIPGFDALAEDWLNLEDGGAVAVWLAAGLSEHAHASRLDEHFFRARFHLGDDDARLGDATRRALGNASRAGIARSVLDIYQLFGDPALRLPRPPVVVVETDDDGELFSSSLAPAHKTFT